MRTDGVWGWLGGIVFGIGLALGGGGEAAHAATYPDSTGEEFSGNAHLDISSVDVTNDATHLTFKINLVGNPVTTQWGKYLIGIDSVAGGNTTGNGWGKPIAMSSGMDFWVGSWVDFGSGFEIYQDNAGSWVREHATYDAVDPLATPVVDATSVTLTMPLSYLDLSLGSTFNFDVYTSGGGGGDSANDASSNPAQSIADWPGPYNSGAVVSSFQVVPEPASVAALGMMALALGRRRRRGV